jgi:hypothetical protein
LVLGTQANPLFSWQEWQGSNLRPPVLEYERWLPAISRSLLSPFFSQGLSRPRFNDLTEASRHFPIPKCPAMCPRCGFTIGPTDLAMLRQPCVLSGYFLQQFPSMFRSRIIAMTLRAFSTLPTPETRNIGPADRRRGGEDRQIRLELYTARREPLRPNWCVAPANDRERLGPRSDAVCPDRLVESRQWPKCPIFGGRRASAETSRLADCTTSQGAT